MSGQRNFGLDVMRAAASICVMILVHGSFWFYHLWPGLRDVWYLGSMAMDTFFVLSGFLIGWILLDTAGSGPGWVRRFWVRRWIRTLPNYYLFLLINVAIWLWTQGPVPEWPKYLVFVQNLAWVQSPFFPESWSLALEEIFYLCAPLLLTLVASDARKPRRTLAVCGAVIVLAIVARLIWVLTAGPLWDEGVKKTVIARGDAILYGVFAVQWVRYAQPAARLRARLALAGVALIVVAALIFHFSDENHSVLARVAPFALNGAGFAMMLPYFSGLDGTRAPAFVRVVTNRLAVWSYSWYLTHLAVMRIMWAIVPPQTLGWLATIGAFVLFVALAITWAWANYTLFEKPVLRWRDRVFGGSEFKALANRAKPATDTDPSDTAIVAERA
ncbi:MAG TPA: acyltransferase [Rudaea sp.]